ncbi:AfsA-related hotdog domain-containing protein [Streptomyces avicenniae]|uniref:AfsA-related hotdog domain-containing protein n=1 Tax=Streptomyces avicenniae TaxID=500153 RepID=UPI00069A1E1D|nr:AfsA-related hotdog domain-containing protein [Streptomyces avicenniae]
MSVTHQAPARGRTTGEEPFLRTVDRRDVHRWAVGEVFLTGAAATSAGGYTAFAQLPPKHHYFTDHAPARETPDSILVLECCRQAATWIAHRGLSVPLDSAFHVTDWALRLTGPPGPAPSGRPRELAMRVTVDHAPRRGDAVRAARFALDLSIDGTPVGRCDIAARYSRADEADVIRRHHRRTAPPWSSSLPAVPPGARVPAADVGRGDRANVVLADVRRLFKGVAADLSVPRDHATLFDHPQDHYPAMILLEAARQAAALVRSPAAPVTGYRSRFRRFAELDAPVRVAAAPRGDGEVAVRFRQGGTLVSEITVEAGEVPS